MHEVISTSLELCSENDGDITDAVYERFFARSSDSLPLMSHSDQYMKGRMLAQVIELLMTDEHLGEGGYLRWEVDNHLLAYGVEVGMYEHFLTAIRDTVQASLGSDWTPDQERAWTGRIESLLRDIYSQAER